MGRIGVVWFMVGSDSLYGVYMAVITTVMNLREPQTLRYFSNTDVYTSPAPFLRLCSLSF
jgi:hypothetical protein